MTGQTSTVCIYVSVAMADLGW